MPRNVTGGLIQAAEPVTDSAAPVEAVRQAAIDMIEEVRRVWQFYRDRRPESYGPIAEQLP